MTLFCVSLLYGNYTVLYGYTGLQYTVAQCDGGAMISVYMQF